ncbi:MAG: DUF3575 domain-containing protein [Bacteroidota bacterium]
MILRIILTFFLLLSSYSLFAQQDLGLEKQLLVKVSPLSFFEPETIIIQGGLEYFFSNKVSIQSEVGVNGGLFGMTAGRGKNEDFRIWRGKSELKFYSKKYYWAIDFFVVNKDFIRIDDHYTPFKREIHYNRARIEFQVFGGGLKFGKQLFISKNLVMDMYGGLGIRCRYRDVEVLELAEFQDREFFEIGNPFAERYRFTGWDAVPQLSLGMKVGILTTK